MQGTQWTIMCLAVSVHWQHSFLRYSSDSRSFNINSLEYQVYSTGIGASVGSTAEIIIVLYILPGRQQSMYEL